MAPTSENGSASFRVRIAATGDTFDVPADKSILYVLVDNGYRVQSLCSNGECGTCRVRYTEGEPDHRDQALSDHERSEYLTVCVSRARSAEIVLDLPAPWTAETGAAGAGAERPVAVVDPAICVACLTCVRACTYGAAAIDGTVTGVGGIMGAAVIDTRACTGCGLCAAACPTGAIGMTRFADSDVTARLDGFFEDMAADGSGAPAHGPRIVAFRCANSAPVEDAVLPEGLRFVHMPCTGRLDNLHLMKAFEDGADGVVVFGCEPGRCFFSTGNLNAAKRVAWIGDWLERVGLAAGRVRMVSVPRGDTARLAEAANQLAHELGALGPNPLGAAAHRSGPEKPNPPSHAQPPMPNLP